MKPWEKRLRDLSQLLRNCHGTYLDPDLFRMNTNQFLQTARTVTFIIQKNKEVIPDYLAWYSATVITPWANDEVMQWAKEARNKIEKEGDLELNSSLNLKLLFSYLEEEDAIIQCGRTELLNAGIKKLVRLAQKELPTGIADAAVVRIERRWVTASLPKWELLHALVYVYGRIFDCCQSLAKQFGEPFDNSIQSTSSFDSMRNEALQVRYLKLNGYRTHSIEYEMVTINEKHEIPPDIRTKLDAIHANRTMPTSFNEMFEYYAQMAELTFNQYGNHVPMLFLIGEHWEPIDMISTKFSDQADKFIFWRSIADRIRSLKASGMVWISELWLRKISRQDTTAIRNLPIVGEQLHIVAIDKSGSRKQVGWDIQRDPDTSKATLHLNPEVKKVMDDSQQYFLMPALRALGLTDPAYLRDSSAN